MAKKDGGKDWPDVALVFVEWLTRHNIYQVTLLLAVLLILACVVWRKL